MERESYSVDDIISEVKKRRAERDNQNADIKEDIKTEEKVEIKEDEPQAEQVESVKEEIPQEAPAQEPIEEQKPSSNLIDKGLEEELIVDFSSDEESEEINEVDDIEPEVEEGIDFSVVELELDEKQEELEAEEISEEEAVESEVEEATEEVANEQIEEIDEPEEENPADDAQEESVDILSYLDDEAEKAEVVEEISEETTDEAQNTQENEQESQNFVNVLSFEASDAYSEMHGEEQEEKVKKPKDKTKKRKFFFNVIIIILVMTICAVIGGGLYIEHALKQVSDNQQQDEEWKGMNQLVENFPEIKETEATELTSLQDMIKTWYYNGAPCSSTHVLNVLLIGEDTRGSEILEDETRADSAIIASINIDTQEITLTSILRDAYAYWENTEGDESSGMFEKINGAMSIGDVHTYIKTVEKLYKINIDNYVIVNFDSFEKIVDEIGGVTLELTSAEIREINNHPKRYGHVTIEQTFDGNSGEIELTGKQALAYCRIRKLDSDNMRADRQKTCLVKIFNKVKGGSKVQLLKVVNTMLPYVKTGFKSSEIVSIAKYALSQGWLTYDVNMTSVPYNRINERGMGGTYYGAWIWRPDYPADAYYLQTLIYGKSSITLAQERVDVIGCRDYGFYSETLTPCYATIHNYAYGEVTTYEFQQKEESTTSN